MPNADVVHEPLHVAAIAKNASTQCVTFERVLLAARPVGAEPGELPAWRRDIHRVRHQTAEAVRKRPWHRQSGSSHLLEDLHLHARRGTEQKRLRAHRRSSGKPSLCVVAKVNLGTTGIHELIDRDPVASRNAPEPATEGLAG
jgi:hypothetical protein